MRSPIKKVKIALVLLEHQKHHSIITRLENYKSKLFDASITDEVNFLPDTDIGIVYSKQLLSERLQHNDQFDFTIGIIDHPIEENYFMRRLSNQCGVITLYQAVEIMETYNLDPLNYLLSCVYRCVTLYYLYNGKVDSTAYLYLHNVTRGCIFDMTKIKTDIRFCCTKGSLCNQCETKFRNKQMPSGYIDELKKELKKIRKNKYYEIAEFIRSKPIYQSQLQPLLL